MTNRIYKLASAVLFLAAIGCNAGPATSSGDSTDALARSGDTSSSATSCPHYGQVAVAEECNAFDDDCDGLMDEGVCDDPCAAFDTRIRRR